MVQKRLERIITEQRRREGHSLSVEWYATRPFKARLPVLRKMEGWYRVPGTDKSIKLSCSFNDILRAADSKHFSGSCFRPGGQHRAQPIVRLIRPEWAVVFLPDRGGNMMARSYVHVITLEERIKDITAIYARRIEGASDGWYAWSSECRCVTCRMARGEKESKYEAKDQRIKELENERDAEITKITALYNSNTILRASRIQGSNLSFTDLTAALDGTALVEEVSDLYI